MHRVLVTALVVGSLSAAALATAPDLAAQQGARDSAAARSYHMVTYYLVLLRRGPAYKATQDSTVKAILAGHMANIERLAREGKMAVAGPIEGPSDLEGIFILNVPSLQEAKAAIATDPAVSTGRLTATFYTWYAASGLRTDYSPTP